MTRHVQEAAQRGYAPAQNGLGSAYYAGGQGVAKNLTKAAELFAQAAAGGNSDGKYNLGLLTREGLGGENRSVRRTLRLFGEAAAGANPYAAVGLAQAYARGGWAPSVMMDGGAVASTKKAD